VIIVRPSLRYGLRLLALLVALLATAGCGQDTPTCHQMNAAVARASALSATHGDKEVIEAAAKQLDEAAGNQELAADTRKQAADGATFLRALGDGSKLSDEDVKRGATSLAQLGKAVDAPCAAK
jgi:hypothetical protein